MLGTLQESRRIRHAVKQVGVPPHAVQYRVELYPSKGVIDYGPCKASEPAALLAAQTYIDQHYAGRTL